MCSTLLQACKYMTLKTDMCRTLPQTHKHDFTAETAWFEFIGVFFFNFVILVISKNLKKHSPARRTVSDVY